eukprot:m.177066 g.177066  ORF g.177066 m.177066 type:complete len:444 (-) comp14280_c0_seq1:109-1440(-)
MGNCNVTGPNEVMVISGGCPGCPNRQTKVIGKCKCAWWLCFNVKKMSLNVMTINPTCENVETQQGVAITVTGVAQIMVMTRDEQLDDDGEGFHHDSEDYSTTEPLDRALQQFLGKSKDEVRGTIKATLEGHLRAILGTMTVEEIYKEREEFALRVRQTAAPDLKKMGLQVLSFTIKDVTDKVDYLDSLGKTRIQEVKSQAAIGKAMAERDADIAIAQFRMEVTKSKNETAALTANYKREFETKNSEYMRGVHEVETKAQLAYELQENKLRQEIAAETKKIELITSQKQTEIATQEVTRKEKELVSTVEKPAYYERLRIETLADADRFATIEVAKGEAEGIKFMGKAEAAATAAIGGAEAQAMELKAGAFKAYGDAAVVDMIIKSMPSIAAEIAAPLERTGDVVLLSGQEGGVTSEISKLVSELPPVVDALTGSDLKKQFGGRK